ncbi:hemicentin-2-like [Epinephelus moara]|uniref:hemicentin-2-like n=1 Tax=Epinephelus moara TaxID=300413 RepID=UPI00214EE46D|nr:hemicentin-2-like [Epinephelus moara]
MRTSSDHRYKMEKKSKGTLAVVLWALTQGVLASAVEVQPSINPAVVGDSVRLSLSPSAALNSGSWAVGESLILTWLGDQQAVFPSHSGRASVNVLTGALTLSSVTVADTGVYTVQSNDPQLSASASFTVLELISNVTLRMNQTDLIEFNSSPVIKCSISSGSSLSFLWLNGSSEVTASDRVQLTDGNSTLTIVNVTRYDQGPFMCHVVNAVSNGTSDAVNFTISYGPDNMALTVNGQNTTSFPTGSNLTMFCSAQSNPPAQLQWAVGGELVNTTGPLLELFSVSEGQSGAYSCLAFNNHTNINSSITANILIGEFPLSGSEQQAVNVWLLPLLLLVGFLFSVSDVGGSFCPWMTLIQSATNQTIYPSEDPLPVGSTVTLFSRNTVTTGAWLFDNDIIVIIFPGEEIISDNWSDRVTFNSTSSSLTIRSLQLEDSGVYTLQAVNSFRAQLTLSVQVPISGVTLRANAINLVEFNDTAVLTCSVLNGSSLSYAWLKGNSEVTDSGGVQFSNGNATLTMVGVTRYDEGPFRCNVSNGLGHEISLPVRLNISYGPHNTSMTIMPMRSTYKTGSNITLSCSAESSPQAMFQWMFNWMYLNKSGPLLQLERVTVSDSGTYKCIIHNTVTARFSSESAMIRIVEPIVAVAVSHTGRLPILHYQFILDCEVTGTVASIWWWKNGEPITADNTTFIDQDNRTLTLNPVQLSDTGDYQCQALNAVSNMTSSPYTVRVNYGPMKPVIVGPSMALMGTLQTLNCSSASYPPSHISWHFNNTQLATTSELTIGPLTLNMSGIYTCMAVNNITSNNSTAYTMLSVLTPVTMALVKIVGAQPIQNHTLTLTCETAGSVDWIIWMYNSSPLYPDSTRHFSMDNATLTFNPVMKSDDGNYQCVASNPFSRLSSQNFTLEVFYGPQMPTIMGPNVVKTGDKVTLSCYASSNPPSSYKWFFNDTLMANTSEYTTPPVTKDMSGMYTCVAYNNITHKTSTAYTKFTVFDGFEHVQVEPPMDPAIEGDFYQLTCNVTGPVGHVYWMKNGEPLHEDNRTVFHMENKMVTFNPVEQNDTGDYQCVATNAVWNMTSPPYRLLVNYGPEKPMIYGPAFGETGHNVTFSCSAMSVPPCEFSWLFNGFSVGNNSEYTTERLSFNMSGEYTCVASNNVTKQNSNITKMLTVIEAIESVMIKNNTVPINSENFTLTCDVVGPYDAIYWMKDNKYLAMTNSSSQSNMSYHAINNTLHFTPVTMDNDGVYHCVAVNQAGPHRSPNYNLLVNYGPLSVKISGPFVTGIKNYVTMVCSADSRPDCKYQWFFKTQSSVAVAAGPVITFPSKKENEGMYICKARNPVTKITLYKTQTFTFSASALHLPSRGGLMLMGVFALSVSRLFS